MIPGEPIIQELEQRVEERTRELSEVLELNRTIIRESAAGIVAFRAETGECVLANEAAAAMVGAPLEALLQGNFRQLKSWRDAGLYQRAEAVLASKSTSRSEVRFVTSFGRAVWLDSVLTHFYNCGESHLLLIINDVSERKQADEMLNRAKEAAEAANIAKSAFLANLSHEIRTPMNAIVALGQLTLQTDLSDQQRDYLLKIQVASQSLLGIFNDILDFSNLEAGRSSIDASVFSLHDTLARLAGQITVRSVPKGLEVLYRIAPEVPDQLVGDALRLEQVLINLLDNAVKFTERGQVVLAVERGADPEAGGIALRFSVIDSGIGLSVDEIDSLFQPFTQSDSSTTRRYGGTGLGLSICRTLVHLMGGELAAVSQPGEGSRFSFSAVFQAGVKPLPPPFRLDVRDQGARVLVLDANPVAGDLLAEVLRHYALNVTVVANGKQALEELVRGAASPGHGYRLVFVDRRLPEGDGLEVVRQLREALPHTTFPAVVIVSAFSNAGIAERADALGLVGFLPKPILPKLLHKRLETALGRAEESVVPKQAGGGQSVRARLRGARVLVVEDHPINLQIVREVLQRSGACVTDASNGGQAVQAVQQAPLPFDLVLMDIQMPVMDGFEATRRIREEYSRESLPIIAMTANAQDDECELYLEAGMNGHIAKPIDLEELFQVLHRWLRPLPGETAGTAEVTLEPGQTPSAPDSLSGLDVAAGVKRMGGNKELFARLVAAFSAEHQGVVGEIRQALAEGKPERVAGLVHMLIGLAGNLGAEGIRALLTELEKAVAAGTTSAAFEPLLVGLEKELRLVSDAARTLTQAGGSQQRVMSEEMFEELIQLFSELSGLLSSNNMQAVQLFNRLAPLLEPSAELEKLRSELDRLDFKSALVTLTALAKPNRLIRN